MITWFPVRKRGLASAAETSCRFSTRRISTGGRSVPPQEYFNHIQRYLTSCARAKTSGYILHVCTCVSLTGLSHRGRQCRPNSQPVTRGEEESVCEERSGAGYHRYASQQHAAEQRSTSHYADSTQTPHCTNTPATKTTSAPLHIIQAFYLVLGQPHPPLTSPFCYSVGEHWRTGNEHQRDSGGLVQSAGY